MFDVNPPLATSPELEAFVVFDLEDGRITYEARPPGVQKRVARKARGLVHECAAPGHVPPHDLDWVVTTRLAGLKHRFFTGSSVHRDPVRGVTAATSADAELALRQFENELRKNGNRRRRNWHYAPARVWFSVAPLDRDELVDLTEDSLQRIAQNAIFDALIIKYVLHPQEVLEYVLAEREAVLAERGLPPYEVLPSGKMQRAEKDKRHPSPYSSRRPPVATHPPTDKRPHEPLSTHPHLRVYLAVDRVSQTLRLLYTPTGVDPEDDPRVRYGTLVPFELPGLMRVQELYALLDAEWFGLLREVHDARELVMDTGRQTYKCYHSGQANYADARFDVALRQIQPNDLSYTTPRKWFAEHPDDLPGGLDLNEAVAGVVERALNDHLVLHPPSVLAYLDPSRRPQRRHRSPQGV